MLHFCIGAILRASTDFWHDGITYIPTGEGWLYPAIVKNLCTRKIEGYAFSSRIDTQLTLAALDMAYRRRWPAKGIISTISFRFFLRFTVRFWEELNTLIRRFSPHRQKSVGAEAL